MLSGFTHTHIPAATNLLWRAANARWPATPKVHIYLKQTVASQTNIILYWISLFRFFAGRNETNVYFNIIYAAYFPAQRIRTHMEANVYHLCAISNHLFTGKCTDCECEVQRNWKINRRKFMCSLHTRSLAFPDLQLLIIAKNMNN